MPRPLRKVIQSDKQLSELFAYLLDFDTIAFDCETSSPRGDGLDDDRFMIGYSVAVYDAGAWHGYYVPIRHDNVQDLFYEPPPNADATRAVALLKTLYGKTLIVHNVAFEYRVFHNEMLDPSEFKYHDTYAMAWLLDPSRDGGNGLKSLVKNKVGYTMQEFTSFGKGDPRYVPIASMAPYAIDDVVQMGKLFHVLDAELSDCGLLKVYQDIYRELVPYSTAMSINGIKIDCARLLSLEKIWTNEIKDIRAQMADVLKMDTHEVQFESSKWLAENMIDRLKLWKPLPDMELGKSGQYSTAADIMKRWASGEGNIGPIGKDMASKVLRTRELSKLINAYTKTLVEAADERDRCHPKFSPMGTNTGRWNCVDPNLQTVPARSADGKLIRECFIADEGMALISADYSQIEYRLLAHFTESEPLLNAYYNGEDLHRRTAAIVYGKSLEEVTDQERSRAKGVNFGIIYGQGPAALGAALGLTEQQAIKFLEVYFSRIVGVKQWMESYQELATRRGYTSTLLGRRRYLPDLKSRQNGLRSAALRRVVNTRIQGSAADLTNLAVRDMFRARSSGDFPADLLLMVHDEIIVTCKQQDAESVAQRMTHIMENVVKLKVPLIAEAKIGYNLRETK